MSSRSNRRVTIIVADPAAPAVDLYTFWDPNPAPPAAGTHFSGRDPAFLVAVLDPFPGSGPAFLAVELYPFSGPDPAVSAGGLDTFPAAVPAHRLPIVVYLRLQVQPTGHWSG